MLEKGNKGGEIGRNAKLEAEKKKKKKRKKKEPVTVKKKSVMANLPLQHVS